MIHLSNVSFTAANLTELIKQSLIYLSSVKLLMVVLVGSTDEVWYI